MEQIEPKTSGITHPVQIFATGSDSPEITAAVTRRSHRTEYLRFNRA